MLVVVVLRPDVKGDEMGFRAHTSTFRVCLRNYYRQVGDDMFFPEDDDADALLLRLAAEHGARAEN